MSSLIFMGRTRRRRHVDDVVSLDLFEPVFEELLLSSLHHQLLLEELLL